MSDRRATVATIIETRVVAIIRSDSAAQLEAAADAICAGGLRVIEFTMTTPNALETMAQVAKRLGEEVLLGAGTVLDPETARAAILAGAQFIVAPTLNPEVIRLCHRYDKAVMPGTFTPTEILHAWEEGADLVKVFPATALGPQYLRDVLAPLPQVKLVPTGGVSLENAADFLKAGAVAVAVGSNLVDKKSLAEGNMAIITERARRFAELCQRR